MSEKKELNQEQLEKVAGGSGSGDYRIVYEFKDANNVTQYKGTSSAYTSKNGAKQGVWNTLKQLFNLYENCQGVTLMYEFQKTANNWSWYSTEYYTRSQVLS